MKKKTAILFFILTFFLGLETFSADWQVLRSRHFVIYHQGESPRQLNRLVDEAERYYRNITDEFGFQRFTFWRWDNRCEIFLYPSLQAYRRTRGSTAWSRAHVNIFEKKIETYVGQDDFFNIILPHELAHIIFREFIGFDKAIPLWLDEGVAMFAEEENPYRLDYAKYLVSLGKQVPLRALSDPKAHELLEPHIFYSQSASIVNFLAKRYGRARFVSFFRNLRDNQDWQEALRRTYGYNCLQELEDSWLKYLR